MPVIIDNFGSEMVISTGEVVSRYTSFATGGLSREAGLTLYDVDPDELVRGVEVEKEHTPVVSDAMKIALDHLTEHPKYYTALAFIEKAMEAGVLDDVIDLARDGLGKES